MRSRLRTVLVGLGRIGVSYSDDPLVRRHFRYATHADVLAAHPAFEWGGSVDPDAAALARFATRWNVPHRATSMAELQKVYEPEVLVIATPPSARLEIVRSCPTLKAVLCEKPLGNKRDDATAFLHFCDERGISVQVNFWRRTDALMQRLAKGDLATLAGRPQAIHGIYGNGLLNNGSHLIDLCRMLFSEVGAIRVLGPVRRGEPLPLAGDVDVGCLLRFVDGAEAILQVVDFHQYREVGLDVWGDQGRVEIWNEGLTVRVSQRGAHRALSGAREIAVDSPAAMQSAAGEALFAMYDNLAAAIAGEQPLASSGTSALRTAAVVETIMSAAIAGDANERPVDRARGQRRMTAVSSLCDVLLYVEDPGAANFVTGLPAALERRGLRLHIATGGTATGYLCARGATIEPVPADSDADALIATTGAKIVAVGTAENLRSLGLRLVKAAAGRGIPSVGLVNSATNAAYRFRGDGSNPLAFCPDVLLVPDPATRDAFITLGLSASRLITCGHPHWDRIRSQMKDLQVRDRVALRQRLFHVIPSDRIVILFAAVISSGLDAKQFERSDEYSLTGEGHRSGRTEIVIEEFFRAAAPRRSALYLVLRLHPKQSPQDLAPYLAKFDSVSQAEAPLECLFAADAVVGMTSMLMGRKSADCRGG